MGTWAVPNTLSETTLSELHEAVISICDRYVYSKSNADEIRTLVTNHAGQFRYGINALVSYGVKLPDPPDDKAAVRAVAREERCKGVCLKYEKRPFGRDGRDDTKRVESAIPQLCVSLRVLERS